MIEDGYLYDSGKEFYERMGVSFHEGLELFSGYFIIFERIQE